MIRAHVFSIKPRMERYAEQPFQTVLNSVGLNLGNMLFSDAMHRQLAFVPVSYGGRPDPQEVRANCDVVIFPAANQIDETTSRQHWAEAIEAIDLPVVIAGLGAQSLERRLPLKLPKGTKRFLKAVSERTREISVRGPFTAEVLAAEGVHNVRVTGCPSLFWHVDASGPTRFDYAARLDRQPERVSVGTTRYGIKDDHFDPTIERSRQAMAICQAAGARGYDYIAQSEPLEFVYGLGLKRRFGDDDYAYGARLYGLKDSDAFKAFAERHFKAFASVDAWVDYMAGRDLYAGTRLHGVIASLLAGTPAALVLHDSRTSEISEFCSLPTTSAEALASGEFDLERLKEQHEAFKVRWTELYRNYHEFLQQAGVPHRLPSP